MNKTPILVTSFNRLAYTERCIMSIVASGIHNGYEIFVGDDGSTDGTKEFLIYAKERGWVIDHILRDKNVGTANNFNELFQKYVNGDHFIISNDDMWFHKGWNEITEHVYWNFPDAATVTFFDYQNYKGALKDQVMIYQGAEVWSVIRTGLGACLINSEAFNKAGMFRLPEGKLMGFFTTEFCNKITQLEGRNKHYGLKKKYFATHTDHPSNPLCERKNGESDYEKFKQQYRKNK